MFMILMQLFKIVVTCKPPEHMHHSVSISCFFSFSRIIEICRLYELFSRNESVRCQHDLGWIAWLIVTERVSASLITENPFLERIDEKVRRQR